MAILGDVSGFLKNLLGGSAPQGNNATPNAAVSQQAPQQRGVGDRIGSGLAALLGFVPENGYDRSPEQGAANIARALLGYQPGRVANEPYLAKTREDQLRAAVAGGDVGAIAKLDPKMAGTVENLNETRGANSRAADVRNALANGDLDFLKTHDPKLYSGLVDQTNREDEARRGAAARFAGAARQIEDTKGPEAARAFVDAQIQATPNLLNDQERSLYEQGGADALMAAVGGPSRNYSRQVLNDKGEYVLLDQQGNQLNTGIEQYKDPNAARLQEAQIRSANALADSRNTKANKGTESDGKPSGFDIRANAIVRNLIDLDQMGALTREGQPSMESVKDNPLGRIVGSTLGDKASLKFSQIDASQKAMVRDFAKAAGIGVGSINSNFELQNVMDALKGGHGFISRMGAMAAMTEQYGGGDVLQPYVQSGEISKEDYAAIMESAGLYGQKIQKGLSQIKSGAGAAPVQVQSVDEARALPKGTVFLTPDGQRKVR